MPTDTRRHPVPRLLAVAASLLPALAVAGDWPTFGHDPQRTGWARSERTLSTENVGRLELKWKTRVDNEASLLGSVTAPVVGVDVSTVRGVADVVFVAGKEGGVFAIDAGTGDLLWEWEPVRYGLPADGPLQGSVYCPNGVNATPTIDTRTGILYTLAESGALYGLDMGSGRVRFGPAQFVAPFAKAWSLNLVGDTVYTTLAQGCGGALSGFYSMDVRDRHRPAVRQMLLSNTNTGGNLGPRRSRDR